MSYLWQEFNIKTFPAETLVFRDGIFCDDLSMYENVEYKPEKNLISLKKTPKLPVHIIYIGEIAGNIDVNIDINAENSRVFMTFKTFNKKPAFLNIFIKNAGKKSFFDGKIINKNYSTFKSRQIGHHFNENTGIFIKNKIAAYNNSKSVLEGYAKIEKNCPNCESDISFTVMADKNAMVEIKPMQYINSVPKTALHSASIYKPTKNQIQYLKMSGLSNMEIDNILEKAFLEQE